MVDRACLAGDLADDGKRSPALGVAFRAGGCSKGRGLGRGVGKIFPAVRDLAETLRIFRFCGFFMAFPGFSWLFLAFSRLFSWLSLTFPGFS